MKPSPEEALGNLHKDTQASAFEVALKGTLEIALKGAPEVALKGRLEVSLELCLYCTCWCAH